MFVHAKLRTAEAFGSFRPVLEQAGLLTLAKSVARMCQLYLGLDETITWCADVDESVCADLMAFILEQGNFGHKRSDDKAAKVLSRYYTPLSFLRGMQNKGLDEWKAARKHRLLRPFAWLYVAMQGLKALLSPGERKKIAEGQAESRRRRELFDRLYGEKLRSKEISAPHARTDEQ